MVEFYLQEQFSVDSAKSHNLRYFKVEKRFPRSKCGRCNRDNELWTPSVGWWEELATGNKRGKRGAVYNIWAPFECRSRQNTNCGQNKLWQTRIRPRSFICVMRFKVRGWMRLDGDRFGYRTEAFLLWAVTAFPQNCPVESLMIRGTGASDSGSHLHVRKPSAFSHQPTANSQQPWALLFYCAIRAWSAFSAATPTSPSSFSSSQPSAEIFDSEARDIPVV